MPKLVDYSNVKVDMAFIRRWAKRLGLAVHHWKPTDYTTLFTNVMTEVPPHCYPFYVLEFYKKTKLLAAMGANTRKQLRQYAVDFLTEYGGAPPV